MLSVAAGVAAWFAVAAGLGVLIGRGIRLADRRSTRPFTGTIPDLTAPPTPPSPMPAVPGGRHTRRAIPLPPIGLALAGCAVVLETCGYLVALLHGTGPLAELFSARTPLSLPHLFVAVLFTAAAVVALLGARVIPGRRGWWTAVGVIAGAIAASEMGGPGKGLGPYGPGRLAGTAPGHLLGALAGATVLVVLWSLSRHERRDRRRVLAAVAPYAAAAVAVPVVSSAAGVSGSTVSATTTYLREAGAALSGVALLVAVLAGVAPRWVLPRGWSLRRAADVHTLDLAAQVPSSSVMGKPGR